MISVDSQQTYSKKVINGLKSLFIAQDLSHQCPVIELSYI
jgi:hypothetical protein